MGRESSIRALAMSSLLSGRSSGDQRSVYSLPDASASAVATSSRYSMPAPAGNTVSWLGSPDTSRRLSMSSPTKTATRRCWRSMATRQSPDAGARQRYHVVPASGWKNSPCSNVAPKLLSRRVPSASPITVASSKSSLGGRPASLHFKVSGVVKRRSPGVSGACPAPSRGWGRGSNVWFVTLKRMRYA